MRFRSGRAISDKTSRPRTMGGTRGGEPEDEETSDIDGMRKRGDVAGV